ncbi:hypothetical protein [Kitasatospora sp. LaBMicrA B282]|uniref:hypothetical protein n=1 Tax=Kitasatospora sp. LaBMicrA B282 TaxID=3420949 RepID=UPI003D128C8D
MSFVRLTAGALALTAALGVLGGFAPSSALAGATGSVASVLAAGDDGQPVPGDDMRWD